MKLSFRNFFVFPECLSDLKIAEADASRTDATGIVSVSFFDIRIKPCFFTFYTNDSLIASLLLYSALLKKNEKDSWIFLSGIKSTGCLNAFASCSFDLRGQLLLPGHARTKESLS